MNFRVRLSANTRCDVASVWTVIVGICEKNGYSDHGVVCAVYNALYYDLAGTASRRPGILCCGCYFFVNRQGSLAVGSWTLFGECKFCFVLIVVVWDPLNGSQVGVDFSPLGKLEIFKMAAAPLPTPGVHCWSHAKYGLWHIKQLVLMCWVQKYKKKMIFDFIGWSFGGSLHWSTAPHSPFSGHFPVGFAQ